MLQITDRTRKRALEFMQTMNAAQLDEFFSEMLARTDIDSGLDVHEAFEMLAPDHNAKHRKANKFYIPGLGRHGTQELIVALGLFLLTQRPVPQKRDPMW